MGSSTSVYFVLFGTFGTSFFLFYECKKLDVCTFQVNSTDFCPSNQTEWKKRSSKMNCSETNAYMCVPNERFTQLVEFCYDRRAILIFKGTCLYFSSTHSDVNVYDCRKFEDGCPSSHYLSSEIYEYPSCIQVQNGCFAAEASCKSQPSQRDNQSIDSTLPIGLGVSIPACFLLCTCTLLLYIIRKKRKSLRRKVRRGGDKEMDVYMHMIDMENRIESLPFLGYERLETLENYKESRLEKAIFNQWEQDDFCFISTNACKEVEKIIKSSNLVIVGGHSGSGKSAIIQHIALEYREQGWIVKRVKKVNDIVNEYDSSPFQKNKTMCVFNDPLGKESFDEILNNSWQTHEEELKLYLKTSKLVMSSRNHIICDPRVTRYLVNQSHIVNIDDNKHKLSVIEKRQILNKYTSDMNLSDKDRNKIVEVERYFPLLCKLYSSNEEYKNKGIKFFTEPVTVLKEEILEFRKKDKGKYCALALLVLFNDDLCVSDLLKNKDTEIKYKLTLKLCGLPKNTSVLSIGDNLSSLKDCFVKKVGTTYHFYHDLVMEATSYVFGTDYSAETLKYADIGFLRRRVKVGNYDEHDDSFTIYLRDRYIKQLVERLYTELFGERLVDVVLNPCLRNEKVIEVMKNRIADYPEHLQMLLETKKLTIDKHEFDRTSKSILMSKLKFLELDSEVSPLFALIALCHTQLSQYCLNILQEIQTEFITCTSALYCNGSIELFSTVFKYHAEESLKKTWGGFYPIHIVSVFHNYELLDELIKIGVNVNEKIDDYVGWTPLILAAGNDTQEYGDYNHRESGAVQRDKTVQLLLSSGADINLCNKNGVSPFYIACENGHDSTVQLLLRNGADINLCNKNGENPLYIACKNGHNSTVQLLLSDGADYNLCQENGSSPLFIACQNGHFSTAELLLKNGADVNLFNKNETSPLHIACQNGYDRTVLLLLRNEADINLCLEDGSSPLYIACQNGHFGTVQILLINGADINLCQKNGASPLCIACKNGHDRTVQDLLINGADIHLCMKNGISPLFIACQNGHESTVQILLINGTDINLCQQNGASPLYIACQNGHESTVHILLIYGADINLCQNNGASPLCIACKNGHNRTVQILLRNGADIHLCMKNGISPLYLACQNGHESTVQLLISNGADINLCLENGASPLYIACQNGHDSIVQLLGSNGAHNNSVSGERNQSFKLIDI